jgi:hypothetical protein
MGRFLYHADLKVMIEACKFARKISQTGPLKNAVVAEQDPGASVVTDDQYEAYIKGALEVRNIK